MGTNPNTTPENAAFCASCGARLAGAARFCHVCGTAVVGGEAIPHRGTGSLLPWAVAGLALIALVGLLVGQFLGGRAAPDAANTEAADAAAPNSGVVRAPDISQMSPQEQADRLFNRVMQMVAAGKLDSAKFFAPMAMSAIGALTPATPHTRYDLGLVALVAGANVVASAQADTILRESPKHLLGLVLAARAAGARGDDAARRKFEQHLITAEPAETARALPEYIDHANDIRAAVAAARGSSK